jgi:hypothetical protein
MGKERVGLCARIRPIAGELNWIFFRFTQKYTCIRYLGAHISSPNRGGHEAFLPLQGSCRAVAAL